MALVCVLDYEMEASRKLDHNSKEFFSCGADDEITVKDNVNAFSNVLIRPRMLLDATQRDLSTMVLGKPVKLPIGISPTAMQRLAHPDGECASAKAAENVGGIMVISFFATSSYEELAAAAPSARKWFQFFLHKNRAITKSVIERAERAGFEAMVFTVDAQFVGKRRVCARNPLNVPKHLKWHLKIPNATDAENNQAEIDFSKMHENLDQGVTWEAVTWLKSVSSLPLVLKGIQTAEDAVRAVELGADAIWVSNHGGRQIDTVPATLDILPSIVRAVGKRAEVYVDGGIRRGTDVYKALALGANMAFIGRPTIWGLAVNGAEGVTGVLQLLRDELDNTMALTGASDIQSITRDRVCRREDLCKW